MSQFNITFVVMEDLASREIKLSTSAITVKKIAVYQQDLARWFT